MKQAISNSSNCGKLMILIGILVAVPLTVIPFYPSDSVYALAFALPAIFSLLLGIALCFFGKREETRVIERRSSMQIGSLTVLFAWGWGIFIGSLPFILGEKLTVIQAIFESVSGWTTTGLSVMDVSITPKIYLFHRSFMQFSGGLGFVLVMIMLVSGKQSMNLFMAEGHPDKLMPNLKKTAQTIFVMYSSFLIIGSLSYVIGGLSLFDGICHAMCALSTGGFSTKLGSIGDYNNYAVEVITIVLMIIGTTNFAVLLLVTKRKWKQVIRVSEVRFMTILLLILVPVTAVSLADGMNIKLIEGFRLASFDVVSALSTSGFSKMSYTAWPPFAIGVLILVMLIGGGIGSTAGGIKMTRVYLMLRFAMMNISRRLLPPRNVEAPYYIKAQGKTEIDHSLADDTTGFVVCYFTIFIIGSLLLTQTAGCGLTEGMFEFASALGTVGLSIGLTGPTTGAGTLLVEMFGMIMGRLEIFIVLIGVYSGFDIIRKRLSSFSRSL